MISNTNFETIKQLWVNHEMWNSSQVKAVSSLKYYDGLEYFGGNDLTVYNLSLSNPKFFIYFQNDIIAGCISYHIIDKTIRTRGIFVYEQFRKQGIAERLLNHVISECIKSRPEPFIWALAGPNSMRVHFKCGFRQSTKQYIENLPDGNVTMHNNCYMRIDL